jgi:hypothetical protein
MNRLLFRLALGVAATAAVLWLWTQRERLAGAASKVEDFGAYWTGASLLVRGENPYDVVRLLELQRRIEPDRPKTLRPNGTPASFTFVMPFTALDYAAARWLWLVLQAVVLLACADFLWRVYGGPPEQRWVAWLVCLGFYPTLQLLGLGQLSFWTLAGLTGFLVCASRGRMARAGAWAGLAVVKPQTVLLLGAALALWSADRRRPLPLLAALATGLLLTLVASVPDPQVVRQYVDMILHDPPAEWIPPTPGSLLRFLFGERHFWLAFVPTLVGLVWLAWYYARGRRDWDWAGRMPLLVFACLLTMPYGWVYDMVLLLPALIQGAVRCLALPRATRLAAAGLFVALNALALALNLLRVQEYAFVWIPPVFLAFYLALRPRAVAPRPKPAL